MARKPTYEELEQRVKELDKKSRKREQAEEQMAMFRRFTETSGQGLGMADLEGNVIYANPTLCRFMGEEGPEDPIGKPVRTYYSEEDLPKLENEILPAVLKKGQETAEIPLLSLKGELTPTIQNVFLIRNDEGEPVCLANVLTDITEHKRAERELKRYRDNLEELVAEHTSDLRKTNEVLQREIAERKLVEDALRESEQRFKELADLLPVSVFELDLDGNFTYSNRCGFKMLGYTREDLEKGMNALQLFIPEEQQRVKQNIRKRLSGEEFEDHEYTALKKDGSTLTVIISTAAITRDNKSVGVRGIVLDISDRKKSEEALRQERDRAQQYLDIAGVIFVAIDSDGTITLMNRRGCEVLEVAPEQIIGKNWFDNFVPERLREDIWAVFQRLMSGEVEPVEYYENPVVTKNRKEKIIAWHNTTLKDKAGKTISTLSSGEDITERKQAEEALRESEAIFRSITTSAKDAIIMMDDEGNITHWNKAAEEIFGYSTQDILGKELHTFLAPQQYHDAYSKGMVTFKTTGQGLAVGKTLELEAVKKDSTIFPIELSVSSVKLKEKWHAIGIIRDITERKRAETIQQEKVKAEAASATKSEFVAKMSHEIRTPMNGVVGMTGLLLDTELTPAQREYAETVRNSAGSLLTLINDILDHSKIEAGKLDLEIVDFDLRKTVDDVTDTLTIEARKKGLKFACLIHHDVPALVRGDPGRFRQILINLAANAIKFTDEGQVVIRATLEKEDDTHATVRVSVSDTGIGIPKESMHCLFEAFTQVDTSTTRRFGGVGLGLTISKQLAELMGGRIGLESQEGKGSTFWFTLVLEKQPEGHEADIVHPKDIRGMRILLVNDNVTTRHVLSEQLRSWDCLVEVASSGEQALDKLHQSVADGDQYSIAILEMEMPGMDGEALGQKIKEDSDLQDIMLVMLTQVGQRGDAKHLKEIGFDAYLTGPVGYSQLYDCLATVTARKTGVADRRLSSIVTRHSIADDRKRKIRILIAEDDVTNQKVALGILGKLGFHADVVSNGKEVLKALEEKPYDLVLMDVLMPEMDGYEATKLIREKEKLKAESSPEEYAPHSTGQAKLKGKEESDLSARSERIPIIAMTAHAMKGDRDKCLEAGMNDYVTKPIEPQELTEAIERQVFGLAQATEPAAAVKTAALEKHVFDRSMLMRRLGDDEELCNELISGFMQDMPVQLAQLKQALDNDDAELVERQAHKIKGASANIGAQAMSDVAFEIEVAGKDCELDTALALVGKLEQELERFRSALSDSGLVLTSRNQKNDHENTKT